MEHILAGNLNKKDIATCLGHCTSTFWYEMFQYWAELNFTNTVSTFEDVANQPIWLNSNITFHKKLLYSDSLISKKLIYVSDILNSDLKLLTLNQFNDKFALQWNEINFDKIILALPLERRRLIDSNTPKTFRKSQNLLSITKSVKTRTTKFFYATFIDKNITLPYNAINKWNRDLGTNDMKWMRWNGRPYVNKSAPLFQLN